MCTMGAVDDAPRRQYRRERDRLERARDDGDISDAEYDTITEFLDKCDERISRVSLRGESAKSPSTLREYGKRLRVTAKRLEPDLTEASAEQINMMWDNWRRGTHPDVKDDGVSQNTLNAYQGALRKMAEQMDLPYEKDEITMVAPEKSQVDPRDLLDKEDIDAMREATKHPRNRALLDFLIWTGQRIRAVQTIRIKDVNLDEGVFYLNTDVEGLKGADGKRPLLLAESSLREWINKYHPAPNDPDAYVFCPRSDSSDKNQGAQPIARQTVNRILKDIAERADVHKPVNPHQFRHHFVTVAKKHYDLDDMTIKGLIGHQPHSRVMEETYAHLKDDDHVRAAQAAMGTRDPELEEDDPLGFDEHCDNCGEPLPEDAAACHNCGVVAQPDAQHAIDIIEDKKMKTATQIDPENTEALEALKRIATAFEDNPELLLKQLEEM